MPPRLIALDTEHTLLLDKPITLIGRHEECDIQLESRKVSRRHCCIAQVEDHLVVRDLESTNGVRINGNQILEGELKDGDELTIGNLRYQVRWDDDPLGAKPARPEIRPKKPRSRPPAPIPQDNLVSCDIPVPIKESVRPKEHPALVQDRNGTERAPDAPAAQADSPRRSNKRTEKQAIASSSPDAGRAEEELPDDDSE